MMRSFSLLRPPRTLIDPMALSVALRGTLAAAVPFLLLRVVDQPAGALFAVIAALNIMVVDRGGSYRTRLTAMLAMTLVMPLVIVAGTQAGHGVWIAAGAMFAVAFLGGLARAFGPAAAPLGLVAGLTFLVGMEVGGTLTEGVSYALYYGLSALWSVALTLVVWRLRPYRRIRFELAVAFEEVAVQLHSARALCSVRRGSGSEPGADPGRRRVRVALENARASLGEAVSAADTPAGTLADLVVLLRAAARISAAAVSLADALSDDRLLLESRESRVAVARALRALERACRAVAVPLAHGRQGEPLDRTPRSVEALRLRLEDEGAAAATDRQSITAWRMAVLVGVNQAFRHLEISYSAALRTISGGRTGRGFLPSLHGVRGVGFVRSLRAGLSWKSMHFRHALRVAVAAAAGTAVMLWLHLPHGIWIPLTTLLVLQPGVGATLERALQRSGGTVLGAIAAAAMVFGVHGTVGLDLFILLTLFGGLYFLRKRYTVAVLFITPLIILLLDQVTHSPWLDIANRVRDTLAGSGLALMAGYLLWPNWERRQLPAFLLQAAAANRSLLEGVLEQFAAPEADVRSVHLLRRQAEIDTDNADASFERMRFEPAGRGFSVQAAFVVMTHLRRLNRHVTALSAYLEEPIQGLPDFGELRRHFALALNAAENVLRSGVGPAPPMLDAVYAPVQAALRTERVVPPGSGPAIESLLNRIIGDIISLYGALVEGSHPYSIAVGE